MQETEQLSSALEGWAWLGSRCPFGCCGSRGWESGLRADAGGGTSTVESPSLDGGSPGSVGGGWGRLLPWPPDSDGSRPLPVPCPVPLTSALSPQRDLDFTIDLDFKGQLCELSCSTDYRMR